MTRPWTCAECRKPIVPNADGSLSLVARTASPGSWSWALHPECAAAARGDAPDPWELGPEPVDPHGPWGAP